MSFYDEVDPKQLMVWRDEGLNQKEIGAKLGCSQVHVSNLLRRLDITWKRVSRHRYPIIEDYFDSISFDQAYILGYLMADACIKLEDRGQDLLRIKSIDRDLVEYIRNQLSPTRPIGLPIRHTYNRRYPKGKQQFTLDLPSQHLVNRLRDFGIIPQKTGNEKLPKIPNKYKPSYLRGLFDGDGCISYSQGKRNGRTTQWYQQVFFIVASKDSFVFIDDVNKELLFSLGRIYHTNRFTKVSIKRRCDIIKIGQYMYSTQGFCLKRKKEKFDFLETL